MYILGTYSYIKTNLSIQNTLAKVILQNSYGESLTLDQHEIGKFVQTSWVNFPNNCAPLSLPTSSLTQGVGDLWMEFRVIDNLNYTATIVLEDKGEGTHTRTI